MKYATFLLRVGFVGGEEGRGKREEGRGKSRIEIKPTPCIDRISIPAQCDGLLADR